MLSQPIRAEETLDSLLIQELNEIVIQVPKKITHSPANFFDLIFDLLVDGFGQSFFCREGRSCGRAKFAGERSNASANSA